MSNLPPFLLENSDSVPSDRIVETYLSQIESSFHQLALRNDLVSISLIDTLIIKWLALPETKPLVDDILNGRDVRSQQKLAEESASLGDYLEGGAGDSHASGLKNSSLHAEDEGSKFRRSNWAWSGFLSSLILLHVFLVIVIFNQFSLNFFFNH